MVHTAAEGRLMLRLILLIQPVVESVRSQWARFRNRLPVCVRTQEGEKLFCGRVHGGNSLRRVNERNAQFWSDR